MKNPGQRTGTVLFEKKIDFNYIYSYLKKF